MYNQDSKKMSGGAVRVLQIALRLFIGTILSGDPGTLFAKEPSTTLNIIADARRRYQLRVRSAKFTWKERIIVPKGTIAHNKEEPNRDTLKQSDARILRLPREHQILEGETTISIDGDKWRCAGQSYIINKDTNDLMPQKCNIVWNNGIIKAYMPPATYDYPMGNINRGKHSDFPRVITARPLFLVFRSAQLGLYEPMNCVLTSKNGTIDDHLCRIVETGTVSSRRSIWTDIGRDYCVLRETLASNGNVTVKTDITYVHDVQHGWVPSGWRIDEFDQNGNLLGSTSATITQWQINGPLDPGDFDLEFPVGTWVRDFTQPSDLGNTTQYILRENGEKRFLNSADHGATYQQLLDSETGQSLLPSRSVWVRKWTIVACVFVFLVSLTILIVRNLRDRGKTTH